jgi:uncharacterized membrane protein
MNGPLRVTAITSAISGLAICIRLLIANIFEGGMPCSGICGAMEGIPIFRTLGFILPWAGAAFYSLLVTLLFLGFHAAKLKPMRVAVCLSCIGALISLALIGYTFVTFHGLCPWCTASTICSLLVCAALLASSPVESRTKLGLGLLELAGGLGVALIVIGRLNSAVLSSRLDWGALNAMPEKVLFLGQRSLWSEHPATSRRLVVFVDLGCGMCRRTIESLRTRALPFETCLRFVPTSDPYAIAASELYLAANSPQERDLLLTEILDDDSRAIEPLEQIERQRKLVGRRDYARSQLDQDWAVGRALGLRSYPLLITDDAGSRRLVTLDSIISSGR